MSVEARTRILVYCDADLNLIDGSAVWTASITQVLALDPQAEVTLLLKRPLRRSLLTEPLASKPNVRLFDPYAQPDRFSRVGGSWFKNKRLQPGEAAETIATLDRDKAFDLILARGLRLCQAVVGQPSLAGRVWAYLTDFTDENRAEVAAVHEGASRLLCQTAQLRDHIREMLEVGDEKLLLLPPMIPDLPEGPLPLSRAAQKLVYVGKLTPLWRTAEMVELMAEIRARHPQAEFHVAGDKFHNFPFSAEFPERMQHLLETTPGVIWHKALSREETQELIQSCDIGCSWRHPDLDGSLELSTKVLEYGAHGKPVLLNRSPMHEDLLGADYPLFCNTEREYLEAVDRAFSDDAAYQLAAGRAWEASRRFTFSAAHARLAAHLPQPRSSRPTAASSPSTTRPVRVVFAGHDLKFAEDVMRRLGEMADMEVRADEWAGHRAHDPKQSREMAEWADVVVAEWCLGNAVWYSHNLPPRTGLIIRLHRVELETTYPDEINLQNVRRIITVSPRFAERCRSRVQAIAERVVYIGNAVDCAFYDKPKLSGSEFRLGLLGGAPRRKRLDLAVDILEGLKRRDDRYSLSVKGKLATDYRWAWREEGERQYFADQMARINHAPWRDSVVFDPFGPDTDVWFRRIGFILSPSDDESFHLSIAEGMASGAIPIIRMREEVPGLYPDDYVFSDVREAVRLVERFRQDAEMLSAHGDRVKQYVRERFDLPKVVAEWERLLRAVADESRPAP